MTLLLVIGFGVDETPDINQRSLYSYNMIISIVKNHHKTYTKSTKNRSKQAVHVI